MTRYLRAPYHGIALAVAILTVATMLVGVGYVTGKTRAEIAAERECRGFRMECETATRQGWQIVRTK